MIQEVVKQSSPFPSGSKMVIFGGGFSGQHIAAVARQLGARVFCSKRTIKKHENDFVFNSLTKELPDSSILKNATHVLSCIPPSENGKDPVLEHLKKELEGTSLQWAGYLSTTGVYGDSKGEWVSEEDQPNPQQERSIRRLACENEWQQTTLPVQILRLPGIYGPGRSSLENIINGKSKMIDKPGQVFSRIHIDDIAGATIFLIHLSKKGIWPQIINIADNMPTTNIEVLAYAASLLNFSLPSIESFEIASKQMSPMALSFWEENRRISNKLLCKKLGYSLIHTDYKSGLRECYKHINQ